MSNALYLTGIALGAASAGGLVVTDLVRHRLPLVLSAALLLAGILVTASATEPSVISRLLALAINGTLLRLFNVSQVKKRRPPITALGDEILVAATSLWLGMIYSQFAVCFSLMICGLLQRQNRGGSKNRTRRIPLAPVLLPLDAALLALISLVPVARF